MLKAVIESRSKKGHKDRNEDGVLICRPCDSSVVVAVADGLGGHDGGWKASKTALTAIEKSIRTHSGNQSLELKNLVMAANKAVVQKKRESSYEHMRTTIVLLHICLRSEAASWAHCGDTRLYHFKDKQLLSVTKDHTVAQMLVAQNELSRDEINTHSDRNRLIRSLGGYSSESDARYLKEARIVDKNHKILICTDGWWEYLLDKEITECMPHTGSTKEEGFSWVEKMESIILTRQIGDVDDRSAVVVGFEN